MNSSSIYLKRYGAISCYLFITVIWVTWCLLFLSKGIDFTDEGAYCSEAWRLSQGDLPFRDSMVATGLSFWFSSWIFYIYPQCPLLGLRIIWALVLLLFALITARITFKYFNPVVSTAGIVIGLFFTTYFNLKVLSYNNMPILGLILATWLWLIALRGDRKIHMFMAGSSGLLAFVATSCRPTLLPLLFLPFITFIYDYFSDIRAENRPKLSIVYVLGYLAGLALFLLLLLSWGVLGDLRNVLLTTATGTGYSPADMLKNFKISFYYYFSPALALVLLIAIIKYKDITEFLKVKTRLISVIAIVIAVLSVMAWTWPELKRALSLLKWDLVLLCTNPFNDPLVYSRSVILLLLALAIAIVVVDATFHVFKKDYYLKKATHERCRLGVITLFLLFLMIAGTSNVPARSVVEIACMPVSMAAGIVWLWIPRLSRLHPVRNAFTYLLTCCLAALLLFSAVVGLIPARYPYRDRYIDILTTVPRTAKTVNIYTTTDRARSIEQLVAAVNTYSQKGDRILAYNKIPGVFYLVDRLPATNTTWIASDLPLSARSAILEDMISRNRLPSLVIRTASSKEQWPNLDDPIDLYVCRHYQIIKDIDGFSLMVPRYSNLPQKTK